MVSAPLSSLHKSRALTLLCLTEFLGMSVWFSASAVVPALTAAWGLSALCLVWGFTVVADSAQFSVGVSELCPAERTGTALTVQTSPGFLLTLVTIRLVPTLAPFVTWRWAFAILALGPAAVIWAMLRLHRQPTSAKMACGRR